MSWLNIITANQKVLYHGTPSWLVDSILQSGLKPSTSRLERNWDQSSANHVYLSLIDRRALQWGIHALESGEYEVDSTNAKVAILSIDVSKLNRLLLKRDRKSIRSDFQYEGTIPPEAISLFKIYDLTEQDYWRDFGEEYYPKCKKCGEEEWNCSCDEGFQR